jgi:hypothetical protein
MRRAPRVQPATATTATPAPEGEPSRTEGARTGSRAPKVPAQRASETNACAERSRHALRCLLQIVPPGRRSGSGETI